MHIASVLSMAGVAVAAAVSNCNSELPCDWVAPAANLTTRDVLEKRGPSLVSTYKSWKIHNNNCWSDTVGHMRALDCPAAGSDTMTVESCLDACESQGYSLAGVEWSQECFCGNTIIGQNRPISDSNCNQGCKGNPNQLCGGSAAFNFYVKDNYAFTMGPAAVLPVANGWNNPVCMKDPDANFRLLPGKPDPQVNPKAMTVQLCVNACGAAGYSFAGLEYGRECYCSNTQPSSSAIAPNSDCDNPCLGDGSSICGGRNRVLVYTKPVAPTIVTKRGIIQVLNSANGAVVGFISNSFFSGAQSRVQAEANALVITFPVSSSSGSQVSSQLQVTMGPSDASSGTLLGLIQGRDNTNSIISSGSYHYLYVASTNPTPKGSPPVFVGNSYTTGTGTQRTSESDVWNFDPSTNDFYPKWINPDGNAATTTCWLQNTAVYCGSDMNAFYARYPAPVTAVKFKFVERPAQ